MAEPKTIQARCEMLRVFSLAGKKASVTKRFTDVFIKRDGRWQAVASQGTQIAQSPNQ